MDQIRKEKNKKYSIRCRENIKETSCRNQNRETKKVIEKAKNTSLTSVDLLNLLKKQPNFVGIFASDKIPIFTVSQFPISFIVNIDISDLNGSHWIALYIDNSNLEIFDSLGFNPNLWSFYPKKLFQFLQSYSFSHRFLISDIYQPPNTYHCGLYCILFILLRRRHSFRNITANFSRNLYQNFSILTHILLNFTDF